MDTSWLLMQAGGKQAAMGLAIVREEDPQSLTLRYLKKPQG